MMQRLSEFATRARYLRAIVIVLMLMILAGFEAEAQRRPVEVPDTVIKTTVDIWSDGTRISADLYKPKNLEPNETRPTIVLCNGWGGGKRGIPERLGGIFADAGYIAISLDYRGWGASDSKMVLKEKMPEPDENGEATVRVQLIREVVDPLDEAEDIRAVLDYLDGEANVDVHRIGLWGTSYGGGLVTWTAAHDKRVKCVYSQVGGMGVMPPEWRAQGRRRAVEIARGETMPIPQGIDGVEGLRGTPNVAKMTLYDVVGTAHRIEVPILLVDAENEELMDRHNHSERVYEVIRAQGKAPVKYHVVKGITHYGIYREEFEMATKLALDWFNLHLMNK